MRKSFKFRIFPNKQQTECLERSLNLCRDLYNSAVQERRDAWRLNRTRISFFDQSKQVPDIRKLNPDYMQIQARVCDQVLRQVDKSFQAFFRRCKSGEKPGFPRFKGRAFFNSFFYNREGFRFVGNKLRLANIGLVKICQHREIEGTIKEVTVKREGSKWYAIVACDHVLVAVLEPSGETVGIDVGIESFATLSDGTSMDNWKYYESSAKQLRVAQRRIARRKKGSNRRRKAVATLRVIHQKIFNQRSDFQHKLSTDLIREYDLIAVEKLNIKGLSKGMLAKQVLDVSWSSFFHKLKYKAENAGRELIEVNPAYTSQDCSGCGHREKKSLSVRKHNCQNCGLVLHRDHNAALNILAAGLAVQDVTYRVAESVS
jgi:putative transposase